MRREERWYACSDKIVPRTRLVPMLIPAGLTLPDAELHTHTHTYTHTHTRTHMHIHLAKALQPCHRFLVALLALDLFVHWLL